MQSDETLQCVDTEKQRNVVKMLRRITLADYFTLSLAIFKASFIFIFLVESLKKEVRKYLLNLMNGNKQMWD